MDSSPHVGCDCISCHIAQYVWADKLHVKLSVWADKLHVKLSVWADKLHVQLSVWADKLHVKLSVWADKLHVKLSVWADKLHVKLSLSGRASRDPSIIWSGKLPGLASCLVWQAIVPFIQSAHGKAAGLIPSFRIHLHRRHQGQQPARAEQPRHLWLRIEGGGGAAREERR